jgi:prepilin-type N-terminal cleavage/methylation domain-containing protein
MNRQKGMTMVELVVAIATSGIIIAFLGTAIYQIIPVSGYGNDRLTATHELENIAHWFNIDGQGAKAATGGSGLALTMADNSSITYTLSGTEMLRTASGYQMTLARNIAVALFSINARVVTMSLTSSPPGRYGVSENGTYRVYLRPAETG